MGLKQVRRAAMTSRHHPLVRNLVGLIHFGAKPMRLQAGHIQIFIILGSPTGGTFTISYNTSSSAVAYNVSAAALQTVLEGFPDIGTGNVSVGLSGTTYTVTLTVSTMPYRITIDTSALTGGTNTRHVHYPDVMANRSGWFTPPGGNAIRSSNAYQGVNPLVRPGKTGIRSGRHRGGGNFWLTLNRVPSGFQNLKATVLALSVIDNYDTPTQLETFYNAYSLRSNGSTNNVNMFISSANGTGSNLRLIAYDTAGGNATNINTTGTAGKPCVQNRLGTRHRLTGWRARPGATRGSFQALTAAGLCYGDDNFGSTPVQCSAWTELAGGTTGLTQSRQLGILNGQAALEIMIAWDKTLTDSQVRTVMRQPWFMWSGPPMMEVG